MKFLNPGHGKQSEGLARAKAKQLTPLRYDLPQLTAGYAVMQHDYEVGGRGHHKASNRCSEGSRRLRFHRSLFALTVCAFLFHTHESAATEVPEQFAPEASEAQTFHQLLQSHGPFYRSCRRDPPPVPNLCQALFAALQKGSSEIAFIAPEIRTDDIGHPALQRYAYCESEEHLDRHLGQPGFMTASIEDTFGARAFRIYRLELDGDVRNGLEEIIYGEPMSTAPHLRGTYNWVDIHDGHCIYRRSMRASLLGTARSSEQDVDSIIFFRKKYFAVSFAASRQWRKIVPPLPRPFGYALYIEMFSATRDAGTGAKDYSRFSCSFQTCDTAK